MALTSSTIRETSSRPSPVAFFLAAGIFLLSFSPSPLSKNVAAFTVRPSAYRRASSLILSAKKDFVISKGLADWASSDQPDEAAADPSGSGFDRRARRQMEKEEKRRRKKAGLGSGSDGPGDPGALDAVDRLLGALGRDPLPRTSAAAYAAFSEDKEEEKSEKFPTGGKKKQFDLASILGSVEGLSSRSVPGGLKATLAGTRGSTQNYKLAWAGSDAAICHLGTGLHNVPLARLQDIYLTLGGRGSITLQEVIRIIGPFPNVKNTLKGDVIGKSDASAAVSYTSLIDGTGKETLGDEPRNVGIDVLYAGPEAFVCAIPAPRVGRGEMEGEGVDGPVVPNYGEKGDGILVFVREDNLESEMQKQRVA
mmetsp:Transcript_6855/g.14268  ORF Transcript_6855/g.14268 Transcript_6855/m.14268 type:complete len:366 (+) Transcript_6855:92-1189(+)|eukprot:CAMPEP_0194330726 /NCGR_PEP_ID=MMETSP0171-20130528/53000_1 /TAXON_ID=218684 /ORGANISM="Corethron pennatum, Strain L29A3" /LENGTH=365 /DNA_ID=CAMNT_0039091897 /DNA_START=24 /DNA_END=1121 /DNA_ORIENTATION=+